ncbi:nuclear transport factor 2 family protein [Bradyrhizobium yuanmingense]|uniref:YybH family protein n=1 Tax=Bradyrhizobium yuanmingense TaxID=108015 RepID=UPI0021A36798|nr:nuclear transport factor 2 family protein [Bradyrhizobium sp. CB1024]UWU82732.1 nuclear transport factor 2 family protein [Bradyrhizobium sp. CB1024]
MTNKPSGLNRWPCEQEKISRRSMMAATAAIPLSGQLSADAAAGSDAIAGLVERAREKNAAFMRGDVERWSQLVRIAPDFTLMQPFGGPTSRGFDASPQRLAALSRYFREGETELEVLQTYASDALVALVMVERQRAEVGGLPAQDWSLRVTEVYRKDGTDWQLVHRHADPLVRSITLQQAAILARGWPEEK